MNRCDIALDEQVRHRQRRKTPLQSLHGRGDNTPILKFGEKILYMPVGKWEPRFHPGVFVGILELSSEAVVVTKQGTANKTRSANIRRILESERWDADRILGKRAVPCFLDRRDNAFSSRKERPAEMLPRNSGELLMDNKVARTHPRRADFGQQGLSEGCPGCRHLRTGQERQQTRSEACRRRIEGLLKGDPLGSARLAAADEKIRPKQLNGMQPRIQESEAS